MEIGIHALNNVWLAKGGRGKKGGLSEYAERIGKTQNYLVELRNAAEVFQSTKGIAQAIGFSDKAKHLNVAHSLPRALWPVACEVIAGGGLSVVVILSS